MGWRVTEIRHIAEAFERKDAMKKVAGIHEQMDEVGRVSTAAVARKKEIHCFKCGEKGHIARDCRVGGKKRETSLLEVWRAWCQSCFIYIYIFFFFGTKNKTKKIFDVK